MDHISDQQNKEEMKKKQEMAKYQHYYYLKRKFIKDCQKVRKPELPKTISIRKGSFTVTFP